MEKAIISLGGSLVYPDMLDIIFLKNFRQLIDSLVKKGYSFVIICGGGKLARHYQQAASEIVALSDHEKDLIGIEATKLNAFLVKSIFHQKDTYNKVVSDPTEKISTDKKIIICSGWKPGWSTDYDAILLAKNLRISTVINMSNTNYVYDSDPNKNLDAKPLKSISWGDFRKLVGDKWSPGLNMPFDPIAAKEAEKNATKVIIIGKDLDNLKDVLEEKEFNGTVIG
jgi:uridylate kinase